MTTIRIRPARDEDLPAIFALLRDATLPTPGVRAHLGSFVVAESAGCVVGVGGLEPYESCALLRSLAVSPDAQGRGIATAICDDLEATAANSKIAAVFLLTESAQTFFANRKYAVIRRADAPRAIAATEEFAELCPESAVSMRRVL